MRPRAAVFSVCCFICYPTRNTAAFSKNISLASAAGGALSGSTTISVVRLPRLATSGSPSGGELPATAAVEGASAPNGVLSWPGAVLVVFARDVFVLSNRCASTLSDLIIACWSLCLNSF